MPIPTSPTELASLQAGRDDYKAGEPQTDREDTDKLVTTIRQATQSNAKVTEDWREAAEESYNFVENKQWDEKDKQYYKEEQSWRPMMTFNKVLPQVRLLSGFERQNREELRVFPREGGDSRDADIMTSLIKYVLDENLSPWEMTRKSNDVYICGRGWIKPDISHDENIRGDVIIERVNPFSCFWDTLSDKWSGLDMRWCQYAPWMTEDEAKELWPQFEDQIKVGDWLSEGTDRVPEGVQSGDKHYDKKLFLDDETKRVRALEHWYKRREVVQIYVNYSTGDVGNAQDEEFIKKFMSLDAFQRSQYRLMNRKMTVVRVATVMHWLLLQDKPSPYKHNMLPMVQYLGLQFMSEPAGLVEYLKDPQRLLNKGVSQTLNHLNRSANSGFFNHLTEGADKDELRKFGSAPGQVIDYKSVKPEPIHPVGISTGHMNLTEFGARMIDETSLLNAEIQGTATQKTVSGRAIEARQRGGMIGNEDFFDNQLLGDKILGYQLIELIQQAMTPERVKRVLGAESIRRPEDPGIALFNRLTNKGQDLANQELNNAIDRCLKAEYDYVVDRSPQSVTIRQQQFEMLMQAAEKWNVNGMEIIPIDIIVDKSDLPESDKARIKQNVEQFRAQAGLAPPGQPPGPMPPPPMNGQGRPPV